MNLPEVSSTFRIKDNPYLKRPFSWMIQHVPKLIKLRDESLVLTIGIVTHVTPEQNLLVFESMTDWPYERRTFSLEFFNELYEPYGFPLPAPEQIVIMRMDDETIYEVKKDQIIRYQRTYDSTRSVEKPE